MIEGTVNENYEQVLERIQASELQSPDHREIRRMLHGEDKLVV